MPPAKVPPEKEKSLAAEIGDRFDFDGFGLLLYLCYQQRRINEVASRDWTTHRIAQACLKLTEDEGTLAFFLWLAIEAYEADVAFRTLVIDIVPEVAKARPETKTAVDIVVSELNKARDSLVDPAVRQAAARSRVSFRSLSETVAVLETYKVIHDSLHQIQVRRRSLDLRQAARTFTTDPNSLDALREFQDLVRTGHAVANAWIQRLPPNDVARMLEEVWIDKLDEAAGKLQDALDTPDGPSVKLAVSVILRILEYEPQQLNKKIFATAKGLPLLDLVDALAAIHLAARQPEQRLTEATDALRSLRSILLARVTEHDLWQDADDELWALDALFLLPANELTEDFLGMWPKAKPRVMELATGERAAKWAKSIIGYAAQLDDELVRLEGELGPTNNVDGLAPALLVRLRQLYTNYSREVRFRFFVVDQSLKVDCSALVAIAAPLQSILDEIAND